MKILQVDIIILQVDIILSKVDIITKTSSFRTIMSTCQMFFDLLDNDVDLSGLYVVLSDIMLSCQIILLLSV